MKPLICVVGPTGVGKTAVAIELCKRLDGEIVSADSMQIYRGLDIATAKPSAEEQARAPHHLIDVREPDEPYSAAQWGDDARAAIASISARGKMPIVAGGTGFYLRALLQPHILASVPPNETLRAELEAEAAIHGAQWLHEKLAAHDSAAAARLHPNDVYRVVRALEVALSPEEGQSNSGCPPKEGRIPPEARIFVLTMPREQLYTRLNARIDAMLQNGFWDELRYTTRFAPDLPSMQSVGYKQMRAALDDPPRSEECIELWKRDTRRYAKRQMTWFRHQLQAQWIDMNEFSDAHAVAEHIANAANA
ncbi:MAG TPA: tRNA (adenosine(37)-N6)-dimethylallyltransferase MiaA [Abditibacteriaceae bacterium]